MSVEWYTQHMPWVLGTGRFSSTDVIAVSFVLLAYVLHPTIEGALGRVKAYRGWRAVENNQTVEVTTYPLVAEVFAGRRRWDAARIVAVLLAAFSLASWGLELSLGIAHADDDVTDFFLRPPPVWKNDSSKNTKWYVMPDNTVEDIENIENMFGNASVGYANARYKVKGTSDKINGAVQIASWKTSLEDLKTNLSYGDGTSTAHVTSADCSDGKTVSIFVDGTNISWGTVTTCNEGLQKVNGTDSTSPALIMNNTAGNASYIIVEESTTYPSFLYSVWNISNGINGSAVLHHVFHISSSARLVEAVVTEIVHASRKDKIPTGNNSFALLRRFSETNAIYGINLTLRASPFGEHPIGERPESLSLSAVETLDEGVQLNTIALCCAAWILALTLVGVAWSLLLRSRIGIDIYNRDELIRAVTMQASVGDVKHSCNIRIFVRKEEGGNLSVVVNDVEEHQNACALNFIRPPKIIMINEPVAANSSNHALGFDGAILPTTSRTVLLEGVRAYRGGRAFPGRDGNYTYPTSIALIASPIPSRTESIVGTPAPFVASPTGIRPANLSTLFDSVHSLGKSAEHGVDLEIDRAGDKGAQKADSCRGSFFSSPSQCESHKTEGKWVCDLAWKQLHSESTAIRSDHLSTSPTGGTTSRHEFASPKRSGGLTGDPDRVTNNYSNHHSEAEEEKTGRDVAHNHGDELV